MIKRFGVRTRSGSNYFIEDETHLFGHPTWFIYVGGKKKHILGLQVGHKGDQLNIEGSNIMSIEDFANKAIKFSKTASDAPLVWGNSVGSTSPVSKLIIFK